MSLDIGKLSNVSPPNHEGAIVAQCPACDEEGCDQTGRNHLIVFKNGKYGCALYPESPGFPDPERAQHLRRIHQLAGAPPGDVGCVGGQKGRFAPRYRGKKIVVF